MDLINEKAETFTSICFGTQGCFEMDPESGGGPKWKLCLCAVDPSRVH